jgi:membrane protein implicated in regulation of membrane protease activity
MELSILEFVTQFGMAVLWILLLILFLVIELVTVGLTTIWLAGGALVALILALLGVGLAGQIVAFFVVSFVLIYFTRPLAVKYINPRRTRTNSESLIGQVVKVTEQINNREEKGRALANGLEWMARSEDDCIIEADTMAKVIRIEGVKLIVKPL